MWQNYPFGKYFRCHFNLGIKKGYPCPPCSQTWAFTSFLLELEFSGTLKLVLVHALHQLKLQIFRKSFFGIKPGFNSPVLIRFQLIGSSNGRTFKDIYVSSYFINNREAPSYRQCTYMFIYCLMSYWDFPPLKGKEHVYLTVWDYDIVIWWLRIHYLMITIWNSRIGRYFGHNLESVLQNNELFPFRHNKLTLGS